MKNTLTINGKVYDATTVLPVSGEPAIKQPAAQITPKPIVVAHKRHLPGVSAPVIHNKQQHAHTLMRKAVRMPIKSTARPKSDQAPHDPAIGPGPVACLCSRS